jgi:hypothetical protein
LPPRKAIVRLLEAPFDNRLHHERPAASNIKGIYRLLIFHGDSISHQETLHSEYRSRRLCLFYLQPSPERGISINNAPSTSNQITMRNTLKTVPRILMIFIIFMSIQTVFGKHFPGDFDTRMTIVAVLAAALLETVLCRYFRSDYGCTSWTFCRQNQPAARVGAAWTNRPEDDALITKIKSSTSLKNFVSFFISLFFTIITIIGVSTSIGKIFPESILSNTTTGIISTAISIPLASLCFRYYQFTGRHS